MPTEFSNYIESRSSAAGNLDGSEILIASKGGSSVNFTTQDLVDEIAGGGGGAVDSVNGQTGVVQINADDVPFTPAGNISATDVQAAIEELDSEKYTASAATESAQGLAELATQAETNAGTDDARIVTPFKIKNRDGASSALTDAGTIDITSDKHTLTTSSSRTFTISFVGDDITLIVTLNATTATQTFPATSLCVSDGVATGNNTCPMSGTSGDKYVIAIKKVGSNYYVACKNFGQ